MVEALFICLAHMTAGLPDASAPYFVDFNAPAAPSIETPDSQTTPTMIKEEEPTRRRHAKLLPMRISRHVELAAQLSAEATFCRHFSRYAAQFVMIEISAGCVKLRI